MSQTEHDSPRLEPLQAELAQLRAALRTVDAPAPDEAVLREQFRAAAWRRALERTAARGGGSWRLPLTAAAAVVLAVGAVVATLVLRGERPVTQPAAMAALESAPPPAGAFQPLLSAPRLSSPSYSVVRVRIPLSAFAVVPGTIQEGTIEADLLVGEDGLARGIRFNEADASRVTVAGPSGQ